MAKVVLLLALGSVTAAAEDLARLKQELKQELRHELDQELKQSHALLRREFEERLANVASAAAARTTPDTSASSRRALGAADPPSTGDKVQLKLNPSSGTGAFLDAFDASLHVAVGDAETHVLEVTPTGMEVQGNVGIGTGSPGARLEVSAATNQLLATDSATDNRFYIANANNELTLNAFEGTTARMPIVIKQYQTEAMRIDATGKVGIGMAPLQPLSVKGKINANSNPDSSNAYYGAWLVGNSAVGEASYVAAGEWYSSAVYMQKTTGQPVGELYTYNPNHHIALQAGSGDQAAEAASGRVGIGTRSPQFKLDVSGDVGLWDGRSVLASLDALSSRVAVRDRGLPSPVLYFDATEQAARADGATATELVHNSVWGSAHATSIDSAGGKSIHVWSMLPGVPSPDVGALVAATLPTGLIVGQHYTHAYWIKFKPTTAHRTLFRGNLDHCLIINQDSDDLGVYANRGSGFIASGHTITNDVWTFMAVTGTGVTASSTAGTSTFFEGFRTTAPTSVGSSAAVCSGTEYQNLGYPGQGPGLLAQAWAFDTVLSSASIHALWEATKERYYA